MKKNSARVWMNIVILAVGVVLIAVSSNANALSGAVRIVGLMFIIPALISMASLYRGLKEEKASAEMAEGQQEPRERRKASNGVAGWITSVGAVVLGAVLMAFPGYFEQGLVYLLAGVLILGGCYHFYLIGKWYRPIVFPGWFYVMPALILLAGAYVMFTTSVETRQIEMIIIGSGLALYAVATFLEVGAIAAFNRRERKSGVISKTEEPQAAAAQTVEAEEVKSHHCKATFE